MTDKILKTSVFEDRGVELTLQKISLDELIQEILTSMKLVFEKRSVRITFKKEGLDFNMEGSKEHLSNVLYNLIDNALKYGGDGVMLEISLKAQHSTLKFSVADNGVGIPSVYQKKIFEKFFRVPLGNIHTVKGYGLGLSYVASVVKCHGGEITVTSEVGNGSAFEITLPRRSSVTEDSKA